VSDDTIAEKRVFDDREGARRLYLATGVGVVRVAAADERVGEFGVAHPGATHDVATTAAGVVAATADDVLVDGEPAGGGRALAVGTDRAGAPLAALADGTVRRLEGPALGRVPDARAVDGGLVAAPDGLYRLTPGDEVAGAGLDDVRDVAGRGTPLAATDDGLYALGPGWTERRGGAFDAVARGPDAAVALAADGAVHRGSGEEWTTLPALPAGLNAVDVARGPATTYVAGREGRLAVRGDGGRWRTQALGTPEVARLAVDAGERESKGERAGARSGRT
jgi:hypothetical protein